MPVAYLIVEMHITNMDQYKLYMAEAPAAVKAFGGEYLVRGGQHESLEGDWKPHRVAMLRFRASSRPRLSTTARDTSRFAPNARAQSSTSTASWLRASRRQSETTTNNPQGNE